jgi:CRP/FNR family transcriptional regulator, cyclic AMP receptor protein
MPAVIRQAVAGDVPKWIDLVKSTVGADYPDKQVYDPVWVASQFAPGSDVETWVADDGSKILSSVSFLPPLPGNNNPVANIGRYMNRPEAYANGAAGALINKVGDIAVEKKQLIISRVFANDNQAQILHEQAGFSCVGFQPFKHMHRHREGVLFYYKLGRPDFVKRLPISDSLPQISELAQTILTTLKLGELAQVRDGATGYPLQTELKVADATLDDFELWRMKSQAANPPIEISGFYNQGLGYFRIPGTATPRALLASKDGQYVAGLAYVFDEVDRCVRLVDSFSRDDVSMGALFNHITKTSQPQLNAVYVEADVLMTAPRLLKAAEQLGFVPIAYLPAIYTKEGAHADVVKMIKLNMVYSNDGAAFTSQAKGVASIIDNNFQDQKVGVAIINLLRALPFFEGLGDGELRKIARLFTQKLFRPGERVFSKGDVSHEAYVVMRGQIDIILEDGGKPVASLTNGQILGEMAFLDTSPRIGSAVANQASIVLVIQRSAFNDLAQHEPHLGMVVMRNIAMELTNRLRKAQKK